MLKAFFMTDKGPFVLSNRFLTYIRRVMTGAWRFFIALLCLVWLIPFSSKVNDDEWFYRCHWIYRPLQKLRNYVRKKKIMEVYWTFACNHVFQAGPEMAHFTQKITTSGALVVKTGWRGEIGLNFVGFFYGNSSWYVFMNALMND